MTLAESLNIAMNSSDCSILTGWMLGSIWTVKLVITLVVLGFIYKLIDKLALEPFVLWIKKKLHRHKGKK